MSPIPAASADALGPDVALLALPDVAAQLGIGVNHVHQALRERKLVSLRRTGVLYVPAEFLQEIGGETTIVKHLSGTITVLSDSGFTPDEMLDWLFTADDSLPGRPIDALRGDRGREVKRRAQALA
ncbi:Rv2175c family DNA-binding protein [Actinokineospora pegani]|uniref:Rv2175c family DNA-binding protein n=1 Tax=Actinokineospora pegani TaxID=2654637 RepID=UPI0018D3DEB8|nr:Rv2175c family DNA-binding protein [Actinokineospora pegani]